MAQCTAFLERTQKNTVQIEDLKNRLNREITMKELNVEVIKAILDTSETTKDVVKTLRDIINYPYDDKTWRKFR